MRTLIVLSDVGTIFRFNEPEGYELNTNALSDGSLVIEESIQPDGSWEEVARFNGGRWALYRWEDATENGDSAE